MTVGVHAAAHAPGVAPTHGAGHHQDDAHLPGDGVRRRGDVHLRDAGRPRAVAAHGAGAAKAFHTGSSQSGVRV